MALPPILKENPQFGVGQFGANAAFDGLLGLRYAWGTTFGLVLPDIDDALAQLNRRGGIGGGNVFGSDFNLFSSASLKMLEGIGHGLTHTQAAAAEKYVTEAWAFEGIGAVIERVAEDAVHTRKLIRRQATPREVVRVVNPSIATQLRPVAQRAAHAEDRAQAAERKARSLEQRIAHLERSQGHPHAVAVPGLPPRIGAIERDLERLKGRVGRIGKYTGLAAFLVLLAKAIEKMGVNWVRCGNVRNVGRRICGMDTGILGTIFADALLIAGTVSLVEFAAALVNVQEGINKTVLAGFKELRGVEPMTFTGFTGELRDFTGYTDPSG